MPGIASLGWLASILANLQMPCLIEADSYFSTDPAVSIPNRPQKNDYISI